MSAYTMTYAKIDPHPHLASFSNDQAAAIEAVMTLNAHVGYLQLAALSSCCYIFAATIASRLP